jgi:cytoskeletal protein CcmA (bactofilin family)
MAVWNQTPGEENKENAPVPSIATPATAPLTPTKEAPSVNRGESIFGAGVTIEGKIEGDANVRIGGKFKGEIHINGDLNVEKGAHLSAKINAANVTIGGELEGNVVANAQVKILESGQLVGDLKAKTLTVAAGSRMRGHVEFGWSGAEPAKFVNGRAHETDKTKLGG